MSEQNFDAFTRQAAQSVSRRQSLMALGGATLAAVATKPTIAEAKKSGKNANQKAKKQARKKCKKQVQQCVDALNQFNEGNLTFCCQELSTCDAFGFIQCLANSNR